MYQKIKKITFINLLLTFLYVATGKLSFSLFQDHESLSSMFFIPEGISFAFILTFGPIVLPAIILAQLTLSYSSDSHLLAGLVLGTVNALENLLGYYLIKKFNISTRFNKTKDSFIFIVIIVCIMQPISAAGGVFTLVYFNLIPIYVSPTELIKFGEGANLYYYIWVYWWIGNSVGQILFAPLLLAWFNKKNQIKKIHKKDVILCGLIAVSFYFIFISTHPLHQLLALSMSYPLLIWIGLKHGLRTLTLANVLLSLLTLWVGKFGIASVFDPDNTIPSYYFSFFVVITTTFSLLMFSLVAERNALIEKLEKISNIDPLTNIKNRRAFLHIGHKLLSLAVRYKQPISLVIFDIDHFKRINDTYGHAAGDAVLKAFTQCCVKQLRQHDILGRIGGEEFALLLPNTPIEHALSITERLLSVTSQTAIAINPQTSLSITFSAGIATHKKEDSPQLLSLMQTADKALYQAKRTGRNRVCLAPT